MVFASALLKAILPSPAASASPGYDEKEDGDQPRRTGFASEPCHQRQAAPKAGAQQGLAAIIRRAPRSAGKPLADPGLSEQGEPILNRNEKPDEEQRRFQLIQEPGEQKTCPENFSGRRKEQTVQDNGAEIGQKAFTLRVVQRLMLNVRLDV